MEFLTSLSVKPNYFLFALTIGVNFLIGIIVYLKDRKNISNKLFALTLISVNLWLIAVILDTYHWKYQALAAKLDFAIAPFTAFIFSLFCEHFPRPSKKLLSVSSITLLLVTTLFSYLSLATNLIIAKMEFITPSEISYQSGQLDKIYSIFIFILLAKGIISLFQKYYHAEPQEKLQIKYVLIGTIIPLIFLSVFILALQRILNPYLYQTPLLTSSIPNLGLYGLPFFTITTGYAILKHRLFDIGYVLRRVIYWLVITTLLFASFYFYFSLSTKTLSINFSSPLSLLPLIILFVLLSLIFTLSAPKIQELIDIRLFPTGYSSTKKIHEYLVELSQATDSATAAFCTLNTIKQTLLPEKLLLSLFIYTSEHEISIQEQQNFTPSEIQQLEEINDLAEVFTTLGDKGTTIYDLQHQLDSDVDNQLLRKFVELMKRTEVALIYNFSITGKLEGFLLLGKRKDQTPYTTQDFEFLELVAFHTKLYLVRDFR
ncbi:hypothetical protein KJ596_00175 [Patescibacteria group bacterium]|nr:hypothetical protein [Patescibacteria group bacterium]MBU1868557.1 hypothetical protein [Patescibacteria group bacterium]